LARQLLRDRRKAGRSADRRILDDARHLLRPLLLIVTDLLELVPEHFALGLGQASGERTGTALVECHGGADDATGDDDATQRVQRDLVHGRRYPAAQGTGQRTALLPVASLPKSVR